MTKTRCGEETPAEYLENGILYRVDADGHIHIEEASLNDLRRNEARQQEATTGQGMVAAKPSP